MNQITYPFDRMIAAGLDAWKLSMRISETMVASHSVIGARMGMLGHSLDGSHTIPMAEFSRLVPEKVNAFSKANAGAARAFGAGSSDQSIATGTFLIDSLAMFDWWEHSLKAANAWWLPVHAQATSNARRLSMLR